FNSHYSEAHFPFMIAVDKRLWQQAVKIIYGNHRIIPSEENSQASFWFDIWTGTAPLKTYVFEDIWNNMTDQACSIQQVRPRKIPTLMRMGMTKSDRRVPWRTSVILES
ncbi:hypothetical protein Taro_000520, partial [Colocasia esculenta]|nr:hypothetical protein [Colocasia esculenta]